MVAFSPRMGGNASCFCRGEAIRTAVPTASSSSNLRPDLGIATTFSTTAPTLDPSAASLGGATEAAERNQARSQPLDWDLALGLPLVLVIRARNGELFPRRREFFGFLRPRRLSRQAGTNPHFGAGWAKPAGRPRRSHATHGRGNGQQWKIKQAKHLKRAA